MNPISHINYKSDFDFIMPLMRCAADGSDKLEEVGWPDYDWTAKFYTGSKANTYTASCIGGVCTNCFDDNGNIHIVVKSPRMGLGELKVEFRAMLPNGIYPDGKQEKEFPQPLNIELVAGRGDCGVIASAQVIVPYIKGEKGDKGDAFTYADFTPEQIAELQKPATEAASSMLTLEKEVEAAETRREANESARQGAEALRQSAETSRITAESDRAAAESARRGAESSRVSAETSRANAETARQAAESKREAAETNREQAETERENAEQLRAEEFASWQSEIDGKQDKLTTSADLAISADNELSLTEMAKMRLFIDYWNDCCGLGLDPFGKSLGTCGRFNESTGYFELNGFTDIDYPEAREIVRIYNGIAKRYNGMGIGICRKVRTIFPIRSNSSNGGPNSFMTDFSNANIYMA